MTTKSVQNNGKHTPAKYAGYPTSGTPSSTPAYTYPGGTKVSTPPPTPYVPQPTKGPSGAGSGAKALVSGKTPFTPPTPRPTMPTGPATTPEYPSGDAASYSVAYPNDATYGAGTRSTKI